MTLYRYDVCWSSHQRQDDGSACVTLRTAQLVEALGERWAKVSYTLHPADGWHESRSEALLAAADEMQAIGGTLLAQAERLRVDASNTLEDVA